MLVSIDFLCVLPSFELVLRLLKFVEVSSFTVVTIITAKLALINVENVYHLIRFLVCYKGICSIIRITSVRTETHLYIDIGRSQTYNMKKSSSKQTIFFTAYRFQLMRVIPSVGFQVPYTRLFGYTSQHYAIGYGDARHPPSLPLDRPIYMSQQSFAQISSFTGGKVLFQPFCDSPELKNVKTVDSSASVQQVCLGHNVFTVVPKHVSAATLIRGG